MDHLRGADFLRDAEAQIERVHRDELGGPVPASELHHQVADNPLPQDDHPILRRDLGALGPRGGAGAEGVEGTLCGRDVRVQPAHRRRVARQAGGERVFGVGRAYHHPIAGREVAHVGTDPLDNPGGRVAHHARRQGLLIHVTAPQLRAAADEAHFGPGEHVPRPHLGDRHLLQDDIAHPLVLGRLPHHVRHYCLPRWIVYGAAGPHPPQADSGAAPLTVRDQPTNKQTKRPAVTRRDASYYALPPSGHVCAAGWV